MSRSSHSASPSPVHPLPEGFRLDCYQIDRLLGRGGFGITYLAYKGQEPVAIKEYVPRDLGMSRSKNQHLYVRPENGEIYNAGLDTFINEAHTLTLLDHPNIIKVFRVIEMHNTAYMVMKYEPGQAFGRHFGTGNLSHDRIEELLLATYAILGALECVHSGNIIHRDIKPDNIQVRADGSPVLLDFGCALQRSFVQTNELQSYSASDGFAPPEQYSVDYAEQGPWTDLYGLAASLYQVLTGRRPASAQMREAAWRKGMADPLISCADLLAGTDVPEGLIQAIDAGLNLLPDDRPVNVAQFAAHLPTPTSRQLPVAVQSAPAPVTPKKTQPAGGKNMDWMELRNLLFSFEGRINRARYWGGQLAVVASLVVVVMLLFTTSLAGISMANGNNLPTSADLARLGVLFWLILLVYCLGVTWVGLAVQVKRWHDRGKTGWFSMIQVGPNLLWLFAYVGNSYLLGLLSAIAYVGVVVWSFVELGCLVGTSGPNAYGADPLDPDRAAPRPAAFGNQDPAGPRPYGVRAPSLTSSPLTARNETKGAVRFSGFDSNGHVLRFDIPLDRLERQPMLISREPGSSTLTIADATISRQHGTLSVDERGLWIKDIGSKNGISVDGAKLTPNGPAAQVYDGSRLVLGGTQFTVKVEV